MAVCTYDIAVNGCFIEITEQPSGKLVRQLYLPVIKWEDKGDDDITLHDGYSSFSADIDYINGYATVAALIAFIDPLRTACSLVPSGGIPSPTLGNGVYTYDVVSNAGTVAAGFQSVSFANIGTVDVMLDDGVTGLRKMIPGQVETIDAYLNPVTNVFRLTPAIDYDATAAGAELKISTYL